MNTEQPQVHQAAPQTQAVQVQAPKHGHPLDRHIAARFARAQRARFPSLHGGWTYHEWCCHQVAQATSNKLAILTKARREYLGPVVVASQIIDECQADAREAFREHTALCRQVDANRRDPLLTGLYS